VLSLDGGRVYHRGKSLCQNFDTVEYITLATRSGKLNAWLLSELSAVRPFRYHPPWAGRRRRTGPGARLTHGDNEIILVTEQGQALRFAEDEVRSMGRSAGGVTGIRLGAKDKVTSMEVIEKAGSVTGNDSGLW